MANIAQRFIDNRRTRREFREIVAAILYHNASPETEPRTRNPFVCPTSGHVRELCTCSPFFALAEGEVSPCVAAENQPSTESLRA